MIDAAGKEIPGQRGYKYLLIYAGLTSPPPRLGILEEQRIYQEFESCWNNNNVSTLVAVGDW